MGNSWLAGCVSLVDLGLLVVVPSYVVALLMRVRLQWVRSCCTANCMLHLLSPLRRPTGTTLKPRDRFEAPQLQQQAAR